MKNKDKMAFRFSRHYQFFSFLAFLILPITAQAAIDQDYPSVKLQTLDKATARTNTVTVKVGDTVEFGSLFVKVQACRKSGPLDQPESAAFIQIWEVPINSDKSEWVFSGWMFASSPALSAMDHPVYDVWVLDCAGGEKKPAVTNNVTVKIDGVEVDANAPSLTDEAVEQDDGQGQEEGQNQEEQQEKPTSENDLEATINSVLQDQPSSEIIDDFESETVIE